MIIQSIKLDRDKKIDSLKRAINVWDEEINELFNEMNEVIETTFESVTNAIEKNNRRRFLTASILATGSITKSTGENIDNSATLGMPDLLNRIGRGFNFGTYSGVRYRLIKPFPEVMNL